MLRATGVLAGVFGTAATGYILKHGTWDEVWGVAVALYLVGAVVWNVFSTGAGSDFEMAYYLKLVCVVSCMLCIIM